MKKLIPPVHHIYYYAFISKAIVVLGFLVLVWYTVETYKIRKITSDQKDLELLPAILIYFKSALGENIGAENIGKGTAVDISIHEVSIKTDDGKLSFKFNLEGGNDVMVSGDDRKVGISMYINDELKDSELALSAFHEHFHSDGDDIRLNDKSRVIVISFNDISGPRYLQSLKFDKNGIGFKMLPKRLVRKFNHK